MTSSTACCLHVFRTFSNVSRSVNSVFPGNSWSRSTYLKLDKTLDPAVLTWNSIKLDPIVVVICDFIALFHSFFSELDVRWCCSQPANLFNGSRGSVTARSTNQEAHLLECTGPVVKASAFRGSWFEYQLQLWGVGLTEGYVFVTLKCTMDGLLLALSE